MKYAYEDLSEEQFEKLVVLVCRKLFGISVQGFAKGVDGGRDAKFVGTAERHPSRAAPWIGTTIIQAKHTNGLNRCFSDPDFFSTGNGSCVIAEEIPRIKKLRSSGELDHYMLFSNRRLGGNTERNITSHVAKECGLPIGSIYLCDVGQLDDWMKEFPDVPLMAEIDPVDCPLLVSPDDLASLVEALASNLPAAAAAVIQSPTPRVRYEDKNVSNHMSSEYAKEQRRRYLKDTAQVHSFLAEPINSHLLRLYESATEEFNLQIISKRKHYQCFDDVMEYLVRLLFGRDPVLRRNKRLTRAVLFYMYWYCDIGTS